MVEFLRWPLVAGFPLLFGALYVRFLTVHPLRMSVSLFGATAALAAWLAVLALGFRGGELWASIPLSLALALGGYAAAARAVLSRQDSRSMPELTRAVGDAGLGHTAVVYFAHGEPETYDPMGWINQFRELDQHRIRFVPYLARPFFFTTQRRSRPCSCAEPTRTAGPPPRRRLASCW